MWPREDRLALQQMLDYAERALAVAQVRPREDLDNDWVFRLGLTKAVEIVGEAANRVSRESQAHFSDIPWREAVTTRNRLTHGYDQVDHDKLWDTVVQDFPPLIVALRAALEEIDR